MRVYRVEHISIVNIKGHPSGPYSEEAWFIAEHEHGEWWNTDDCDGFCVHDYIDGLTSQTPVHRPAPRDDNIDPWSSHEDYLFGCESFEKLKEWFRGDIRKLDRIGYVVAVYIADDVMRGRRQLVFNWNTCERVGEFPLTARKEPEIRPLKSLTRA